MQSVWSIPTSGPLLEAALEGLTRVNVALRRAGQAPALYTTTVRYRREPPRRENWRNALETAQLGWGDCEDLAAWLAADRRVAGDSSARVIVRRTGPKTLHALVRSRRGIEDPSRRLGMGRPMQSTEFLAGYEDDELGLDEDLLGVDMNDCTIMGADDTMPGVSEITFDVTRDGNTWRGRVRVPMTTGRAMFVRGPKRKKKQDAAGAALSVASKALRSPVAQALLPPPAKLALNILKSKTARKIASKAFKAFKSIF